MNKNLLLESVAIKPRRVYQCEQDKRIMERKDVKKDSQGKYHCSACGGEVEDITSTTTGQHFMEVLAL